MIHKLAADHPLHLVGGFTIWSIWFIAIYGGLSIFCSGAESDKAIGILNPINIALLFLTGATGIVLVAMAVWCWHTAQRHLARLSAGLYFAATIATIAVAAPIFYLPPCI